MNKLLFIIYYLLFIIYYFIIISFHFVFSIKVYSTSLFNKNNSFGMM